MIEELMFRRQGETSAYMGNKALKILKTLFNYAVHPKQSLLDKNPTDLVEKLPVETKAKDLPTTDNFMKVREKADPIEKCLLDLLLLTSARIGELLELKWKDDRGDHIILRTRKHKGGAVREDPVRLTVAGREIMKELRQRGGNRTDPEDYVFVNPRTRTRYLRMPKRMKGLCKKAGVKPFGFHKIRALSASLLAEGRVPLTTIQEKLRHLRATTTDIYLKGLPKGDEKAEAVLDRIVRARSDFLSLILDRSPDD